MSGSSQHSNGPRGHVGDSDDLGLGAEVRQANRATPAIMPHGRIKKLRAKAYSDSGCPSSTAPTSWTAAFWAHPKSLVTAGCSSPSSAWYPPGCFTPKSAIFERSTWARILSSRIGAT